MDNEDLMRTQLGCLHTFDKKKFEKWILSILHTFDEDLVSKWMEENKCDACENCKRKW